MVFAGSGVVVAAIGLSLSFFANTSSTQVTHQAPKVSTVNDRSGEQTVLANEITVFRSPNCGCCGLWIDHLEAAGFQVKDNVTENLESVKQQYDIPENLATCHTAVVAGYVIEGHVPVEDIQRLLAEKPAVAGLAVPGMPIGSPGMESGGYVETYTVFSFTEDGNTATFAEHS
ncbi:DUF411 domain-containing protein [Pleurocapsales cyanobacterium LEGE 06147]|nr:DUF411 domain-containing protein [Pleurocapsales cyanobacterium LEGE 06147]